MFQLRGLGADDWSTMTPDEPPETGEARDAAATYCGKKFGVTSPNFQPCVDFYAGPHIGEFVPKGVPTVTPKLPTVKIGVFNEHATQTATLTTAGKIQATLIPPGVPWYKTPLGMIGLLLGGLFAYKRLRRKS